VVGLGMRWGSVVPVRLPSVGGCEGSGDEGSGVHDLREFIKRVKTE
jgi:hypothetical protein